MTPQQIDTILWRLSEQDKQLERIEQHAKHTNGRVSKLEIWIARAEGARNALSWVQPLVIAVVSGGVVAVAEFLLK